jgi:hypothetical protein
MIVLARRIALAALAAALCVGAARAAAPAVPFETLCAELPPSRFEIVQTPLAWTEGETLSIDQLTVQSGYSPGGRMTFGSTTASFGARTHSDIRTIDDRATGRACGTVDVRVELSMQPVTVHLAQELEVSRCARQATMEHELQHVEVFRQVLAEAARDLAAELPDAVGRGVQRAATPADLQQRVAARISDYVAEFIRERRRVLDERQAAVDSPQEYARVRSACPQ